MKPMPTRLGFAILAAMLSSPAWAALTITPITWNVIGLDSNNVNTGPDTFPVGARVCNVSGSPSGPLTATFVRDGATNTFLTLLTSSVLTAPALPAGGAPPSQYTISTLPANCYDFYYEMQIARSASARDTTQGYHITITDGASTVQTPAGRVLYVEKLISQNRNGVDSFTGPAVLYVGQTVTYTVNGHTATGGYEQVEFAPVLPVLFQMLRVSVSMAVPTGGVNSSVYADACGWENDPTNPDYWRASNSDECHLTDQYTGGKAGGDPVSLTYVVKALTAGSGTMTNVWYDFSGSSFHYNSDVGTGANTLPFTILTPTSITGTKTFSANPIGTGGQTSTLTITLNNPNPAPSQDPAGIPGVAFTDVFPTSPGAMTLANTATTNSCGGTLTDSGGGALNAGDVGIGLTGGTIPWGGSCTITVVVTAPEPGNYTNTIAAGGVTTSYGGASANASAITGTLSVASGYKSVRVQTDADSSGGPTVGDTLQWSVFYRNPSTTTAIAGFQATDTIGSNMTLSGTPTVSYTGAACASGTANAGFDGAGNTNLFTAAFSFSANCTVRVDYSTVVGSGAGGTTLSDQASATGTGVSATLTDNIDDTTAGLPAGVTPTAGSLAQTQVAAISPTTAAIPQRPTISKNFAPDPIGANGASTLTVTLTNPNASALTGATFTDLFPTTPGQMTVASPLSAATTCAAGTLSENDAIDGDTTLEAGDGSVRLSGATIPGSSSCTVTINVTATVGGTYTNTIAAGALVTSGGTNAAAASDTLTVNAPSISAVKSSVALSDPFNSTTNPKRIPGGFVTYSVVVTNSGDGAVDSDTVIVLDTIPANTDLYVGDVGGVGSGPVAFTQGSPTSALTYSFTSLASTTDDVSFSNDGGATFTYTPVPNGSGVDAAVTHIRINPKGAMAADAVAGPPSPNFTVSFRVRVE
jgi:uncharacterized repeat protein (TIGR01451 family)